MSKTVTLRFRCTEEEAAEIRMRAFGMDLSKYLRLRAMAQPLTDDEATPHERAVLGGRSGGPELVKLVKQLKAQGRPDPEAEARKRLGI